MSEQFPAAVIVLARMLGKWMHPIIINIIGETSFPAAAV